MSATKPKSVCLLCLKRFATEVRNEHHSLTISASNNGEEEGTQGRPCHLYSRFLRMTSRYLKISASERFLTFAKEHEKSSGENVKAFCENCQVLVGHACDLYVELQTVKLHLLRKVDELETVTRNSSKCVSLKLARGLIKSLSEQLNVKSARQLELFRKTLIINCHRRTKEAIPKVSITCGLFPEEWRFTYTATKRSLMSLILIFALATTPTKREVVEEPSKILKEDNVIKVKHTDDRRKVAFEDIAHHFFRGSRKLNRRSQGATDGVATREAGPDFQESNSNDAFDADGGFPDIGDDDRDSDWSTGAASPTGSNVSTGSDANDDENVVPTKRRKLRNTRHRLGSGYIKVICDEDEGKDDPDFKIPGDLRRPPPLDPKHATLPCKHCKKLFVDRRGLAKHLRDIHNTHLDYICDICGYKCKTYAEYAVHRRQLHPGWSRGPRGSDIRNKGRDATLPCPKCKRKFIDARGLSRHMQGSHNSRLEYSCNLCGHKSKTAADHMSHRSKMHRRKAISAPRPKGVMGRIRRGLDTACRICEKQFSSRSEYLRHNKEVHQNQSNHYRFECPVCMKQITNDQRFKRHLIMHEKETSVLRCFHCEVCGKTFYTENTLSDHFVNVHDGSYSCSLCEANYPASSLLRAHLEIHETEQKNFFCNFCFRGYTNEQYWQIHRKVAHVGNERMFCDQDQCAEEFNNVEDLNEHLKNHIEELRAKNRKEKDEKSNREGEGGSGGTDAIDVKPCSTIVSSQGNTEEVNDKEDEADQYRIFACSTCGWGFLNKYSLTLHELVHIPYEKDIGYRCPNKECNHVVRLKDKLISHYNRLHGQKYKPYACHECGHKFCHFLWFKTHLKLHEERKSGRKFICDICNTECLDSINLSAHKRTHNSNNRIGVESKKWVDDVENSSTTADGDGVPKKRRPGRPRYKTRTDEELRKEKEEEEKLKSVPCEVCGTVCVSVYNLRKHLDKEHEQVPEDEKTIHCNFCYLKFAHSQTHIFHCLSIHLQKYKFVCDAEKCDEQFENHLDLNEHLKKFHLEVPLEEGSQVNAASTEGPKVEPSEHPEKNSTSANEQFQVKVQSLVYCKKCNWGFVNPDILELHELCHIPLVGKASYPCPGCGNMFPSTRQLTLHYNTTHGKKIKPFKCLECPAKFCSKEGLRLHISRHNRRRNLKPDEKLVCIDCGKTFLDMHLLNYHKKSHDPVNHVLCPEGCGETFINKMKLGIHLKKVHGQGERYPCHMCGMSFIYEYETKQHMKWVHGPAKFECDICHKMYKRPSALRRHKRSHNPDVAMRDSYICSECGAHYKSEEGLKFHLASIHTPDHLKKFSCPHCSYKTHRRMLLKMHLKVCCRNKGIPYDEKIWGKLPEVKPYKGPPRKRGRRPQKNQTESEDEEEMEEKTTTEEEDNSNDEGEDDQKPEAVGTLE